MTTLRKVLPFVALAVVALWTFTSHQSPLASKIAYAQSVDCSFTFTFTGNATTNKVSNLSGNVPCVNWRVTFSVTGTLSSTVTFQTSPDGTTWTSVPNTVCSSTVQPPCVIQGANPMTGTQGMLYAASYGSYVRVITSGSSGTGTGTIRAYGAKGASASAGGIGAGGGGGTVTNTGALTLNAIVTGNGGSAIKTPSATSTLDSSGNISTPGNIASGVASGVSGAITLNGSASGSATIQAAAAQGTPNALQLPTATGTAGQFMSTDGGNPQQLSWATPPAGGSAVACPENPIAMTAGSTYTCTDNLHVATGKFLWCQDPSSTPANAAVQVSWAATINTFTWVAVANETVNCYATLGGGSGGGGSILGTAIFDASSGSVASLTVTGVVSGITYSGQGEYVVSFTAAQSSYVPAFTTHCNSGVPCTGWWGHTTPPSAHTTSFQFESTGGANFVNCDVCMVMVFSR